MNQLYYPILLYQKICAEEDLKQPFSKPIALTKLALLGAQLKAINEARVQGITDGDIEKMEFYVRNEMRKVERDMGSIATSDAKVLNFFPLNRWLVNLN